MKIITVLASAIFAFTAQAQESKETRILGEFNKLKVSGAFDITLVTSDKNEVTLFTDKETAAKIETNIEDGKLTIRPQKGFKKYKTIEVKLKYKSVNDINLFGSGDFTSEKISADDFSFSTRGSGDAKLAVDCANLEISVSGSGDLNVSGKADNCKIKGFGSGNIHGFELVAKNITLESKGSGDFDINATETIVGESYGSGDIECKGGGKVDIKSLGSGTVTSR